MSNSLNLLKKIELISADLKTIDPLSYEMSNFTQQYVYCHICSANSQGHLRGICDNMLYSLKKEGITPLGVEGIQDYAWTLMDFDSVLVHVFQIEQRQLLDLDNYYQSFDCKIMNASN